MSNTAPFLHIAYANDNTGTLDFTTTGGIERTYTGFYTDEYATDSSDPTKYKWLTNAEFKNKLNKAAYAKSADGKDGFTTVYPNLNLLTGTSKQVVRATSWYMKVADIKYDTSLGETLCASVLINNADHASELVRGGANIEIKTIDTSGNTLKSASGGTIDYNANGISQASINIDNNVASIRVFIVTNNMANNAFYSCLKLEQGSTATPYMPSLSEVKDSDYPQYIGFSNIETPTTFKDYEWTLLENVPKKILNTHVAYANSSDGTTDFTTVYPNLNLLVNSAAKTKDGFFKNFDKVENGYGEVTLNGTNEYVTKDIPTGFSIQPKDYKLGDKYTMSMDIMFTSWNIPAGTTLGAFWIGQRYTGGSWGMIVSIDLPKDPSKMLNQWIRITKTSTIPPYDSNATGIQTALQAKFNGTSAASFTFRVRNPKQEIGSVATPYMPSASEVKDSDYPKFVGVYGDDSTTASQVPASYKWSSISTPGPTPPLVNNLYILTMPTVKSINLTYGIGTLTTKPITWLSAKPKLDVNQVLWYKSEITGTDNSVGVHYSNIVGGSNLDDGDFSLDNTVVSMVLNNKIVNIPRDLALKLDLLYQTSSKRDDELAQLIADTNDRITNIDLTSGQQGLIQEISDRKAGDAALNTKIETTNGNLSDLKTNIETELTNVEKQIGGFLIQGTKNISTNRPAIVFDYNAYGTALPDGSTDGGGRLNFQVPGDTTYTMRELKFDYKMVPSFYDLDQIMIWEKSWSQLYGGFSWRDTIITTTDIDKFYIDGMTSYYDSNGDIAIRGKVVLDGVDDWIGQMNNRGFRPDSVTIIVAKDLKSIKSMRFVGVMGIIIMNISLGFGASSNVQRLSRRISFIGSSPKNTLTTVGSWVSLNEKIPYGMRPTNNLEVSTGLLNSNNTVCYNFTPNASMRIFQASNNANQYQAMGHVGWETFDQYPPANYSSNSAWQNR